MGKCLFVVLFGILGAMPTGEIFTANIDKKTRQLTIICDYTVNEVASMFVDFLNEPKDGRHHASKYGIKEQGNDMVEITYGGEDERCGGGPGRQQAFVMKEGNAISIIDAPVGVGIDDIESEYKRLCESLRVTLED